MSESKIKELAEHIKGHKVELKGLELLMVYDALKSVAYLSTNAERNMHQNLLKKLDKEISKTGLTHEKG